MSKLEGGCLCGAVRYTSDAEPVATGVCHCRNCQKQAGTAFSVVVGVPEASLHITGKLTTYEDRGDDSGQPVLRKFCGRCGSPIVSMAGGMPGVAFIKSGTLDDVSQIKPTFQCWHDSAQPWLPENPALASFPRNPSM